MSTGFVLESLAAQYPQLYLDPDQAGQEMYRRVVLHGEEPEIKSLAHYHGDPADRLETVDTPAGTVQVATMGDRQDFELVLRGLLAAKDGPQAEIPATQGAAMLSVFNWPRINAYLAGFAEEERGEAFRRFTSRKENYIDQLIVLSRGPYSSVPAQAAGYAEEEWLALSDTIRRYHELTHVICRRLYPDDIDPVRDELVADTVGLYAAFGAVDQALAERILGIRDGRYVGGRLANYADKPDALAKEISSKLLYIKDTVNSLPGAEPFDLIPVLMHM